MAAAQMPPRSRDWTLHILEPEEGGSNLEKSVNSGISTPASKKKGGIHLQNPHQLLATANIFLNKGFPLAGKLC